MSQTTHGLSYLGYNKLDNVFSNCIDNWLQCRQISSFVYGCTVRYTVCNIISSTIKNKQT